VIRVVFDTNIYISGLHFPGGIPRKLLKLADLRAFQLVLSKQIIAEVRNILRVKFGYKMEKLNLLEDLLFSISEIVEPKERINYIKKDPDDNKILECGLEAKADFIVSGDKHLLSIRIYKGIKIISAREFLEFVQKEKI